MNRFSNLRTMVDRFLVDTCSIRDLGAEPTFDPDTFTETVEAGDVVYTGRCRLRPHRLAAVAEIGGVAVTQAGYELTLPYTTVGLKVNQTVTLDASDDPMLVGRTYRVVDVLAGSDGAYRRVIVEDIVDQAEWAEVGS